MGRGSCRPRLISNRASDVQFNKPINLTALNAKIEICRRHHARLFWRSAKAILHCFTNSSALSSKAEAARIAACKELLDRGYWKAPLALTSADGEASAFPTEIEITIVRPSIDAPPKETREGWIARRQRELSNGGGALGRRQ